MPVHCASEEVLNHHFHDGKVQRNKKKKFRSVQFPSLLQLSFQRFDFSLTVTKNPWSLLVTQYKLKHSLFAGSCSLISRVGLFLWIAQLFGARFASSCPQFQEQKEKKLEIWSLGVVVVVGGVIVQLLIKADCLKIATSDFKKSLILFVIKETDIKSSQEPTWERGEKHFMGNLHHWSVVSVTAYC